MTQSPPVYSDTPEIDAIDTWSTPLFVASNPYHDLLKSELLREVYDDAESHGFAIHSQVAEAAKGRLAESDLGFLAREQADIQTLKSVLEDLILTVASDVNAAHWPTDAQAHVEIIESWYHITHTGGFHDAHSHPNCSWCGIYYLAPGESDFQSRSGLNRFYDPRVNAEHYQDAGTAYLSSHGVFDMEPKEGQVILFPSYLKHSALPYFGQQDRVVIAFNAQVHLDSRHG